LLDGLSYVVFDDFVFLVEIFGLQIVDAAGDLQVLGGDFDGFDLVEDWIDVIFLGYHEMYLGGTGSGGNAVL
jgi:hypothetical protein